MKRRHGNFILAQNVPLAAKHDATPKGALNDVKHSARGVSPGEINIRENCVCLHLTAP
jgi:hypothetical protein